MSKIKEWIKEHKKELIITSVSVAVGAVGGVALYKYGRKTFDENYKFAAEVYDALLPASNGAIAVSCTNLKEMGVTDATLKDCPKIVETMVNSDWYDPDRGITGMAVFLKDKTK